MADRVLQTTETAVREAAEGKAALWDHRGSETHLPALVGGPVVRVVLGDVIVDSV